MTQAISPTQLRTHAAQNFNFAAVYDEINESLKRAAMRRDITAKQPIKVGVKVIPQWTIDQITATYIAAGWSSVRVAEDNGQFCTLEFYPD